PRVGLCRRVRLGFAAAVLGALHVHGAKVEVVLHGEILSPHGGIIDLVIQLHDAIKRISRLLLALKNVDQQGRHGDWGQRRQYRDDDKTTPGAFWSAVFSHSRSAKEN